MSTVDPSSTRTLARGAVILAVASFGANVLAYLMSLVLSRSLGPADYGAMAALLALAVVGTIPPQAEQFVAARHVARSPGAAPATGRAWRIGVAMAAACAALSIPAAAWLDLPSQGDLALLGLVLLPLTPLGVRQGALLGAERQIAYGIVLASLTGGRFVAAAIALALGRGVTGVLVAAALASWITWAVAVWATRTPTTSVVGGGWRELAASVSTVACVFVVTSIDVVAARGLLPSSESGWYAVAGLFARIAFWGPYAVVLVVFPRVARGLGGRPQLALGLAVTAGAGAILALGAAVLARPFIVATSGAAYTEAAAYAPWMALLGAAGACLQLLLVHALAREDRTVEALVWAAAALEIGLLALLRPSSAGGIIAVAVAVQAAAAVAATAWEWRSSGPSSYAVDAG